MASTTGLAAGLCNLNALNTDFKKLSTFSSGHLSLNANVVSKPLVYSSAHQRSRNNCRTLRVYSLSGENEANEKGDEKSSKAGNLGYRKSKIMEKVHTVLRANKVKATKELAAKEFDGYCEDELVKATLNGSQQPVRIEITEAAIKLSPEKLSLLVGEAYKDAHKKSAQDMKEKSDDIGKTLVEDLKKSFVGCRIVEVGDIASQQIVED